MSAPIVAKLLQTSNQNGAARPTAPVRIPLSAGPIARLMLIPTLLAATAAGRSSRGTSDGTIDCQGGAVIALAAPITNINTSSVIGVTTSNVTSAANIADATAVAISTTIRKRRLSTMSASAPAGSANRNIPKLVATCTSDTINGCVVRFVIAMRPPRCTSRYRRWRRRLRSISPQTCGDGMGSTENERTWLVLERP